MAERHANSPDGAGKRSGTNPDASALGASEADISAKLSEAGTAASRTLTDELCSGNTAR